MSLLALGGTFDKAENFEPNKIPDENDEIICNPLTGDLYISSNTKFKSLNTNEFGGDIYYDDDENRVHDIYRNYELELFFIEQPQFTRA